MEIDIEKYRAIFESWIIKKGRPITKDVFGIYKDNTTDTAWAGFRFACKLLEEEREMCDCILKIAKGE